MVKKPVTAGSKLPGRSLSRKDAVVSVQWGSRSKRFVDGYWEMVELQLQKKFTKKIADSIVRYAQSMYFPSGFDDNLTSKEGIKMYVVTTFDNNFGGKFRGVNYIVWVPYEENRMLWKNNNTRPNDFFLVFPKDAIVLQN